MQNEITLFDKHFVPYLSYDKIIERIQSLALELKEIHSQNHPLFLPILNGSFIFSADLAKEIDFPCEFEFVKIKSYSGTQSTGVNVEMIGVDREKLADRHVVILEDIIDTGHSLDKVIKSLEGVPYKSLTIVTLLFKPEAFEKDFKIDHIGFSIPNKFILGYGLDYDGYGRNLKDIYQLKS